MTVLSQIGWALAGIGAVMLIGGLCAILLVWLPDRLRRR